MSCRSASTPSIAFGANIHRRRVDQPKFIPAYGGSLHFTGIPMQFAVTEQNKNKMKEQLKDMIEDYLYIGKTSSMDLFSHPCQSGRGYVVEAYVDFAYWYQTECTVNLAKHIEKDLTDRRDIRLTGLCVLKSNDAPWTYLRVRAIRHSMIDGYGASYPQLKEIQNGLVDEVNWSSLYIPFLPENLRLSGQILDANELSYLIDHHLGLGRVKRIDFIDRAVPAGAPAAKSAFVHFDYWYDNYDARSFRATMLSKGAIQLYGYNMIGQDNRFALLQDGQFSREPQYITLKINRAPIPDAPEAETLNVHQLAVAKRALEQQLAMLSETVRQLEAQLTEAHVQHENDLKIIRNLETDNATLCSHLMEQGKSTMYSSDGVYGIPSVMSLSELMV